MLQIGKSDLSPEVEQKWTRVEGKARGFASAGVSGKVQQQPSILIMIIVLSERADDKGGVNRNLSRTRARAVATVSRRTHPLWPLDASAGVYRNY